MREFVEFRVNEKRASEFLAPNEGKSLGSVRAVLLPSNDPRIPEMVRCLRVPGKPPLYFYNAYVRKY